MTHPRHITILGAGPAGLAAAYYADRAGLAVDVYEAGDSVGGNCRTLCFGEFRVDTGAHRLHDRDADTTALARELLGNDLLEVDAPSQIYFDGRLIDFPLAPRNLFQQLPLRTIAAIARENAVLRLRRRVDGESFGEVARSTYGRTLASIALLGYSRKLWGRDPDDLLPEVAGSRLARLDARTFVLEALRGSRTARRHLDGSFMYPRLGIGQLFERLGDRLGSAVHTASRVTRIAHEGDRVSSIRIGEREVSVDGHVLNTLPLGLTAQLLYPAPSDDVLSSSHALCFRHLRLLVLIVDREQFSPNASIYFPDPSVPFTRLYESKNRSPAMATAARTALVLEVPCEQNEPVWSDTPEDFARSNIGALTDLFGLRADEVIATHELRVPNAYPVLERSSLPHVERMHAYLSRFDNMTLVGRNACFEYSSIHDLFRGARHALEAIAPH